MKRLIVSLILLALLGAVLMLTLSQEKTPVYQLGNPAAFTLYSPYEVVEAGTYDGLIFQKEHLYDTTSLVPQSVSVNDCPT